MNSQTSILKRRFDKLKDEQHQLKSKDHLYVEVRSQSKIYIYSIWATEA